MKKPIRYILPIITLALSVALCALWLIQNIRDNDILLRELPYDEVFSDGAFRKYVNINTASADELALLPGIGPSTAKKIIAYRQEHGPFVAIEEILYVPGIHGDIFHKIKTLICVR